MLNLLIIIEEEKLRLREQELLYIDEKGLVWPGFSRSK